MSIRTISRGAFSTSGSVHYAIDYGVVADGVTDNAIALQAAVDSFPGNKGRLILPVGTILTSAQINLPTTSIQDAVLIEGAGKQATIVKASGSVSSWAGKAVFRRDTAAGIILGGGLMHLNVDCSKIADYGVYYSTGKMTIMESLQVINARVTEGLFGDLAVPRFYETKFIDCGFYSGNTNDPATRPDYNLRLIGYASDNEILRTTAQNAKLANISISSGGNSLIACHAGGVPEADYSYDLVAGNNSVIACYADGFGIAGIYVRSLATTVIGNRFFWPNPTPPSSNMVRIAAGLSSVVVMGNVHYLKPAASVEMMYDGAAPYDDSYIQAGLIKTDGQRVFLGGHSTSLNSLSNARLQVAGTDFNGSISAVGRWSADQPGPFLAFYKSRGALVGDHALVAISDFLGNLNFSGSDGVTARAAAGIQVRVDGTPAAGDVPGRLEFTTAAQGGGALTVRLTVDNKGNVVVNNAAIATNATEGFLYIPSCPGPPTGVPHVYTGRVPLVIDSTTNKLYFYSSGAWRDAGP